MYRIGLHKKMHKPAMTEAAIHEAAEAPEAVAVNEDVNITVE